MIFPFKGEIHLNFYVAHRGAIDRVNGMVVSSQPLATLAGVRVLMDGANAIDAAVATAACWGVVIVRPTYEKQNCLFYPFRFAFECRDLRGTRSSRSRQ